MKSLTALLEKTRDRVENAKLASDDHGHDTDALRVYCEKELCYAYDTMVPNLLAALEVAVKLADSVASPAFTGETPIEKLNRFEREARTALATIERIAGRRVKRVLDVCCGSKMFWFDKAHPEATYVDIRKETHQLRDSSSSGGTRQLIIQPDFCADFTQLPFEDESYPLIVFDPPHLIKNGNSGWLAKKYGKLGANWKDDLRSGFSECFRVLKPDGVLIFKWNEREIPVSQIIDLAPVKPLFGNRCGRLSQSHWIVFMKEASK